MKLKACFFTLLLVFSISNNATAKFWGQDNSQSSVHRAADGNCAMFGKKTTITFFGSESLMEDSGSK